MGYRPLWASCEGGGYWGVGGYNSDVIISSASLILLYNTYPKASRWANAMLRSFRENPLHHSLDSRMSELLLWFSVFFCRRDISILRCPNTTSLSLVAVSLRGAAKNGDEVWILFGCSMPMALLDIPLKCTPRLNARPTPPFFTPLLPT
jgi:hypothetical protein